MKSPILTSMPPLYVCGGIKTIISDSNILRERVCFGSMQYCFSFVYCTCMEGKMSCIIFHWVTALESSLIIKTPFTLGIVYLINLVYVLAYCVSVMSIIVCATTFYLSFIHICDVKTNYYLYAFRYAKFHPQKKLMVVMAFIEGQLSLSKKTYYYLS